MDSDWKQQLCPHIAANATLFGHVQGARVLHIHIVRWISASVSSLRLYFVRLGMVSEWDFDVMQLAWL